MSDAETFDPDGTALEDMSNAPGVTPHAEEKPRPEQPRRPQAEPEILPHPADERIGDVFGRSASHCIEEVTGEKPSGALSDALAELSRFGIEGLQRFNLGFWARGAIIIGAVGLAAVPVALKILSPQEEPKE